MRPLRAASVDKLVIDGPGRSYCQPCLSPVWDTALALHALMEAGAPRDALEKACDWLVGEQILDVKGDWADWRPDVRPGGWAFQYANPHYPDLDDTAVVVMALDRFDRAEIPRSHRARRGMGARHAIEERRLGRVRCRQ